MNEVHYLFGTHVCPLALWKTLLRTEVIICSSILTPKVQKYKQYNSHGQIMFSWKSEHQDLDASDYAVILKGKQIMVLNHLSLYSIVKEVLVLVLDDLV
jgi:hypothetical protein